MRIRAAATGEPRGWEVSAPPGTTVGALAAATGLPRAAYYALGVGVVAVCDSLERAGATEGAILGPVDESPRPTTVVCVVVDGPDTGRVFHLATGSHAIGRHPSVAVLLCDPAVGALHAEVHVAADGSVCIRDRTNLGGTWLGSARVSAAADVGDGCEVRVGATILRLDRPARRPVSGDRPAGSANRPPRVTPPDAPNAPTPPVSPAPVTGGASIRNLLTMLVPSLAGVGLAAAVRPDMVVLALIAPIGALASWLILRALDARGASRSRVTQALLDGEHHEAMADHRRMLEQRARDRQPDLAEVLDRVRRHDPRLWERRRTHDDFLRLSAGIGDLCASTDAVELHRVPVEIDATEPFGIVGRSADARATACAFVAQVSVHHGPADVAISVWTTDPLAWNWARWLPHGDPAVSVLTDESAIAEQVERWRTTTGATPFVVLDADGLPPAWRESWNALLDLGGTAMVLTDTRHRLPEQCAAVVCLAGDGKPGGNALDGTAPGASFVTYGRGGVRVALHRPHHLRADIAEDAAAGLAARRDPDVAHAERSMPASVGLVGLLGLDDGTRPAVDRDTVLARWRSSAERGSFIAPIGIDASGPLELDLVIDGPHGLIAGTTGSGKSELLRSLVTSFAATIDAENLAFVLVDYKGGSAFDGLAALPHVVDVITDLDSASAKRAVRGLEAEVHRRERALRSAGVSDIAAHHRERRHDTTLAPMPRLVIVVDEFATLAQELPSFVDALVDVAQRGRSLGVHLLLATQRPAGAVKDAIRTNTNLRIALRVLDATDSRYVLGSDDAATIARGHVGRAIIRRGAGELRAFQAAYVSGATPRLTSERVLIVAPMGIAIAAPPTGEGERDLDRVVRAVAEAHALAGWSAPTRPWADPLPEELTLALLERHVASELRAGCTGDPSTTLVVPFALVDEPHLQRHAVHAWTPAMGNLVVAGMVGSGTTTALVAIAAGTLAMMPEDRPDLYVITMAERASAWLADLPHVGAVIATDDDERVRRLLRMLGGRIDSRRRGDAAGACDVLVLVDGIGALRAAYDSLSGMETLDRIDRLATEGPSAGIYLAFGAEHPSNVGHRIDRTVAHRVLLRLGERSEYASAGVRDIDPSALTPGSGVDVTTGYRLRIARAGDGDIERLARCAEGEPTVREPATRVGLLPITVASAMLASASIEDGVLQLPLGIGDRSLTSLSLRLHAGEHALVTGPTRCGKSNVLAVARVASSAAGLSVVSMGTHRSRLPDLLTRREDIVQRIDALLREEHSATRTIVLIDDADAVDDGGALERLIAANRSDVHLIAAARGDRLRSLFRHWTNEVRRSGNAVLLRPDDGDAEVVGVRLPRTPGLLPPGRGWLVCDGIAELCQLARAAPSPGEPASELTCAPSPGRAA